MKTQRKERIKDLYLNHINRHDLSEIHQFVADDYSDLVSGGKGIDAYKNNIQTLFTGFPDVEFELIEMIEEGDKLVLRWLWKGTHLGFFAKTAATARPVVNSGVVIFSFRGDKIISTWTLVDRLNVMQQISG